MDSFTTAVLARVVRALDEPSSFLLDTFFGEIQTEDSEEIHFDVENEARRITPFVSPIMAGKVVKSKGFTAKSFKPAYAKDKRVFDPNAPMKRSKGEAIGGNLSPQERRDMALRSEIEDQLEMLTRREEVMAAEALRTGKITVSGDGFDTVEVDFGRAAALTITLAGADVWTDAASDPVGDLEDTGTLIQDNSGAVAADVVMAPDAWAAFRSHDKVQKVLDIQRGGTSQAELGPLAGKVRQPGSVGDFRIWVYNDSFIDEAGATQKYVPSGQVYMASRFQLEGVRAYGVIRDEKAGYEAQRFFVKSWLEEDPAVRWLLLQSAPLVVPYRVNATARLSVL